MLSHGNLGHIEGPPGQVTQLVSDRTGIRTHALWPLCMHFPSQHLLGNLGAQVLLTMHLSRGFWSACNVIPEAPV